MQWASCRARLKSLIPGHEIPSIAVYRYAPHWRTIARMKTLMQSNPFLRSAKARKWGRYISVKTSSAIEGIRSPFAGDKPLRRHKDVNAFIAYWKRRSGR